MLSASKLTCVVAMVTLMVTWGSHDAAATPLTPYPVDLDERNYMGTALAIGRQILKVILGGRPPYDRASKRNGGTLDTLYNLPDLSAIGRRR